ncbi:MAG: HAD family hydrolase [Armatimonadetes bacterium]|nr:HAD family hydrolase [Armatimonadota bacterium]MBS1711736.1 HAD family hydrolase [Armatimonadota bacterium]MBX3109710.1 HAD family hydrolase [Fimbriimonadaceae bacterium]
MLVPQFADVKAVFFDLDDTLCGYWDAAKSALRKAFADHPEHGHDPERLMQEWSIAFRSFVETIGKTHWYEKYCDSGEITRVELMRRTLDRLDIFDDELAYRLSFTYHVERQAALELFPEALEVLQALKQDYPLGIITNGPADIQRLELEKLQITSFFDHIFIEGEHRIGKPDERIFRMAEESVGLPPEQLLFVGNSYGHDIKPAQAFGWKTAWIRRPSDVPPSSASGRPDALPESAVPPDLTITDLRELLS